MLKKKTNSRIGEKRKLLKTIVRNNGNKNHFLFGLSDV